MAINLVEDELPKVEGSTGSKNTHKRSNNNNSRNTSLNIDEDTNTTCNTIRDKKIRPPLETS